MTADLIKCAYEENRLRKAGSRSSASTPAACLLQAATMHQD
jgi:hypothetical protein